MSIKLQGATELARAIERLPRELQRTVESTALRAGMAPVRKAARAHLGKSKDSGLLQKSLGLIVKKTRGRLTARVGARTGFGKSLGMKIARKTKGKRVKGQSYEALQDPVKYAGVVEYGSSRTPAKPYIRPAVESSEGKIITEMAKGYDRGMEKIIRKIRSRK
jgi:HK97 gp10 family phage protein